MGFLFSKLLRPACYSTKPLPKPLPEPLIRRYRVPVFGLDNAGKTAILRRLCDPSPSTSTPSLLSPPSPPSPPSPYSSTTPPPLTLVTEPTIGADFYLLPLRALSPRHHHHYLPPLSPPPLSPPSSSPPPSSPPPHSSPSLSSLPPSPPLSSSSSSSPSTSPSASSDMTFVSDIDKVRMVFTDITGQLRFRPLIFSYPLPGNSSIIFVLDASDRRRFEESKQFLIDTLYGTRNTHTYYYPLLIFVNKMDVLGAMTLMEVKEGLGLRVPEPEWWTKGERVKVWEDEEDVDVERRWCLQGCSAVRGEGLMEGVDWLVVQMEDRRRKQEERAILKASSSQRP
ncbi:MAG: P-loop containing nucleoside triphosphate hydrolase protein [Linnemannia gamsii]|nr:MAG: P-loop containing nucleoside triphosphate hydrolase protein [Linnemannia gamsii]